MIDFHQLNDWEGQRPRLRTQYLALRAIAWERSETVRTADGFKLAIQISSRELSALTGSPGPKWALWLNEMEDLGWILRDASQRGIKGQHGGTRPLRWIMS